MLRGDAKPLSVSGTRGGVGGRGYPRTGRPSLPATGHRTVAVMDNQAEVRGFLRTAASG
jgi:hypothetical protein